MKVLFMTNIPSPYRVKFFSELGKKCDLTVVYERKSAADRDKKWNAIGDKTYKEIYLKSQEIGSDNSISFDVLKYIDSSYDHIVVGMYSTITAMIAILYMKIKKIPFIISTDGGFVKEESKEKYLLKRRLIGSASAWLSTGNIASKYLVHYGADRNRIYNYSFTSLYDNDILREVIGKQAKMEIRSNLSIKEPKVVVAVGQFIYRKGFDLLINAASMLDQNVGIYIIGGKETEEYRLLCEQNACAEKIHFLEFMSSEDLKKYYYAADVFVLPTREDIWGLVINEALASGLPVITTQNCAAGVELVDKSNGVLIESDNVDEIVQSIKKIVELNDKEYALLCEGCLKKIHRFTFETMAEDHICAFNEIKYSEGSKL